MGNEYNIRTTSVGVAAGPLVLSTGIAQIDLDDLATHLKPALIDPAAQFVSTNAARPGAAGPTSDNHRYTIHLPTPDAATFSIGHRSSVDPWHIDDTGITGRTNSHIHWHTAVGVETQSILILGNATNERKDVPAGYKGVASANTGYVMVTEGAAFSDARLQQYLVSREDDVIIRAPAQDKVIALQADLGIVEALAGQSATVGAKSKVVIAADSGLTFTDPGYKDPRAKTESKYLFSKITKGVETWLDAAVSGEALVKTLLNDTQSPAKDSAAWKTGSEISWAKFAIDSAKLVSTVVRELDSYAKFTGMASAGLYSSGGASVVGDVSAGMFGNLSASVTSVLSASMLAMTTSVKGLLYTSLWAGKELSVKSRKDLKLEAEKGKGSLKSKLAMYVASTTEGVIVQGEQDVRLASVGKKAFVFGKAEAVFTSGDGDGFGVAATKDELHVGKMTAVGEFKGAGKDASESLVFKKGDKIEMTFQSNGLMLNSSGVALGGKAVDIHAQDVNVTIKGVKILLG